jgi:glycolate oxidase iron-sulfur subunit
MSGLQELARRMKALGDQLATCMRCGLCQGVCPLHAQTGREADVARGKLALLDGLARSLLDDPQGVADRLRHCLLCGSCAANCPSGVKALDIFLEARAILSAYLGLSPMKRLVLRGFLANPRFFDLLLRLAPAWQPLIARPASSLLGTSCARLPLPGLGTRHFKGLAAKPFHALVPETATSPAPGQPRVAFFVGCLIDKVYPQVGQAALKALAHHGVGVLIPPDQACCGMPALAAGDAQAFASLLTHNLARFDPADFDHLLTACATCTTAIKHLWPGQSRLAGMGPDRLARVEQLAAKTLDISQFLADRFLTGQQAAPLPTTKAGLTYHDPCHLKKSLGVWRQPRQLLQANAAWSLVEMAEPDWCCGMGGSFNLEHYQTSAAIGARKRDNILATGVQAVATACPACMLQITDALSQAGARVDVRHVLEIYAQALPDGP